MGSIVLRYILKHIRLLSVKKNRSWNGNNAAMGRRRRNWRLKSQDADTDGQTGVNGADPAENQTPVVFCWSELEGNEVNPWPYIPALLC